MSQSILKNNIAALSASLQQCLPLSERVEQAASLVVETLRSGGKLLVCGNGGSAADAMHLSTEFVSKFDQDRRPFPSICLNSNGGDLTAIGNDYAYEQVFSRQVNAFAKPGDLLVAFTSSGKSRNVLLAIEAATNRGAKSIAFLGKDGGFTVGKATIDILVPGTVTARIQEAQKLLLHTVCEIAELELNRE